MDSLPMEALPRQCHIACLMQCSALRTATSATADICLTAAAIPSAGDSWDKLFLWLIQGHVEPEGGRWKGHKLSVAVISNQVELQLVKESAGLFSRDDSFCYCGPEFV